MYVHYIHSYGYIYNFTILQIRHDATMYVCIKVCMYVCTMYRSSTINSRVRSRVEYKISTGVQGSSNIRRKKLAAVARDRHQAEKRRGKSDPGKIDSQIVHTYAQLIMKSYLSLFIILSHSRHRRHRPNSYLSYSLIPQSWRIRKIFVVKSIVYAPPRKYGELDRSCTV